MRHLSTVVMCDQSGGWLEAGLTVPRKEAGNPIEHAFLALVADPLLPAHNGLLHSCLRGVLLMRCSSEA